MSVKRKSPSFPAGIMVEPRYKGKPRTLHCNILPPNYYHNWFSIGLRKLTANYRQFFACAQTSVGSTILLA